MTLKEQFEDFRDFSLNPALDAFDNCIENACLQFTGKQEEFFHEKLLAKDTSPSFIEDILGSIFIGIAGSLIDKIASRLFTPIIKTRALIIQKGNNVIVSKLSKTELENFKNTSLPRGMNFLSDDSTTSFAKTLFKGTLDLAAGKLIPKAISKVSSSKNYSNQKATFISKTDLPVTTFKEMIDFWKVDFQKEQNKFITAIIRILISQKLPTDLEKATSLQLSSLKTEISEVDTLDEMRQIRYYYELCLWSIVYRDIIFHGFDELRTQPYNDVTLQQAKSEGYQYPYHFNDVRDFNLPKNIPKNAFVYWSQQFPHPSNPDVNFEDYYNAFKPSIAQRYNVSILQGHHSRRKTQDPKYLEPLLAAEMYYDLANYMQRIASQFEGATKFTEFIGGIPKKN